MPKSGAEGKHIEFQMKMAPQKVKKLDILKEPISIGKQVNQNYSVTVNNITGKDETTVFKREIAKLTSDLKSVSQDINEIQKKIEI